MRIALFGEGALCDAIEVALEAQGHTLSGPFAVPQSTNVLRATQARIGLAAGYRPKFTPQEWECFPDGILNVHYSLLPWCAGVGGNYWPILEGSPCGVTVHWVDGGYDTGAVFHQSEIAVEPWDTAGTLLEKQIAVAPVVVGQCLADLESDPAGTGEFRHGWRPTEKGTRHTRKEFPEGLDLDAPTTARKVLNLLRARTCPPYPGLRYRQDGKLIEATITLKEVTE